ncbi:helix-turn-helix domain-containing protein [Nodularia harveyana UHCC-0300]|uniref:Helix-turn-helix domain-containing protein n=1 Tax=Nodularia harveyana UHCC-0300 TaxID=2974287 RepID=A0ABU5UCD6_9CYAN|nr:helix-turn-helix domain-containing protein [Nodularia harveyana]MEA5580998.1 helix-turn-helix domain-containing protein [Nodularia harveyana UHCC-0300]
MSEHQANAEVKVVDNEIGQILTPFQRRLLQKRLQEDLPNSYRQRIEIILLADQGKSQAAICQILGCSPATVRHWMHIARSGMAHKWQDCPIGRPKVVNEAYLQRLQELVVNSPRDYGYAFGRWTANWLGQHLAKEFGIEVSDRHIKRLLKQMGLSTRPKTNHHQPTATENPASPSILIQDLKSDILSETQEFSHLQLTLLDSNFKTHGAKSIRFRAFSRTAEPSVRLFLLPGRISQLLPTI